MDDNLRVVLDFMTAAQTLTAIYGSPDGPIDPLRYYEMMASLLDDPKLLVAQLSFVPKAEFFVVMKEQIIPARI